MAKPELGTKRLCSGCGAKYYDLNKDPIVCPKCSTVFVVTPTSSRSRPDAAPRAPVVEEEVAVPEAAEAAEFVSLEDADKEAEGAKPGGVEGGDDEAEDEPLDDGNFIVPEEEEEDDVTDIIGDGIEKDEET